MGKESATLQQQVVKPTIGRIVHAVVRGHSGDLMLRPMIIVHVWSDTTVNGQVFLDGSNDHEGRGSNNHMKWLTSVTLDNSLELKEQTWRWPKL